MSKTLTLVYLAVLAFTVGAVRASTLAQEPSPGERHTPEGTYCTPQGVATSDMHVIDPSHPCHCAHMTHSKDCEGDVQENNKCSNYCKKQACKCPVVCDPHDPPPQEPEDQS